MNNSQSSEPKANIEGKLEALLTECEYARIIKRSVASVRRDRARHQGCPYVKVGALVRYRLDDIRAYIEHNLKKPAVTEKAGGGVE